MPDGVVAECVVNVSEGRDEQTIDRIRRAGGEELLDIHSDPEHHRSVLTLGGPLDAVVNAARRVASEAVATIDLRSHTGIHPRLGAIDVVPFVPLDAPGQPSSAAVSGARDEFARWAGDQLQLPCFLYGSERSLPDVRRRAFRSLDPDTGPMMPHPTAGAAAVGTRPVLVAYNVWITGDPVPDLGDGPTSVLSVARSLADRLRGPHVRSLGLGVDAGAQVSFNLTDPAAVSPSDVYDAVARGAESNGCSVLRAELVGLVPAPVLAAIPAHRWAELDLGENRTIESRLAGRGQRLAGESLR